MRLRSMMLGLVVASVSRRARGKLPVLLVGLLAAAVWSGAGAGVGPRVAPASVRTGGSVATERLGDFPSSALLQPDGKIVVAGRSSGSVVLRIREPLRG